MALSMLDGRPHAQPVRAASRICDDRDLCLMSSDLAMPVSLSEARSRSTLSIAFVIPAYNEEALIGPCLDSVVAEVARFGGKVEIIAVDNNSTDRTAEIVAGFPTVRLVREMRKGPVFARSRGFDEAANAELIASIDGDTIVPAGWLDVIADEFGRDPELVCLSGPYVYYDLPRLSRMLVEAYYVAAAGIHAFERHILRRGAVVQGGNVVLRRSAWVAAGGYDTSIEFYGDDTDIAMRMSRVGSVHFTRRLRMLTSGRRLAQEGLLRTGFTYALNFFWVTFTGRPITRQFSDIRPASAPVEEQLGDIKRR